MQELENKIQHTSSNNNPIPSPDLIPPCKIHNINGSKIYIFFTLTHIYIWNP